ncbi:MAG: phosphatase PAP2 family protein [Rhizomicrobium sp.]|nr:phosphatase PAP2 family protein [Rhizomicrobium sp.]
MNSKILAGLAALTLFAGLGFAEDGASHPSASYLKPGTVDILSVLPPAPVVGDPRYDADRAVFRATRRYQGSPRWDLATNDVQYGDAVMLKDFGCALGVALTPDKAPHLMSLLAKAGHDTQRETNIAKNFYRRLRPFLIDEGKTCQKPEELKNSFDYPSGHTTGGWTWALVLADVAPERASQILARGRAYGESRIVCGAHNNSAVEAGRLSATVTMSFVHNTPAYSEDLQAARSELAALRKTSPAPALCEAETDLVKLDIFAPAP